MNWPIFFSNNVKGRSYSKCVYLCMLYRFMNDYLVRKIEVEVSVRVSSTVNIMGLYGLLCHSLILITLAIRTSQGEVYSWRREGGLCEIGHRCYSPWREIRGELSLTRETTWVCLRNIKMETVRARNITSVSLSAWKVFKSFFRKEEPLQL